MAKRKKSIRLWCQAAWFAVTNGYLKGFVEGKIYRGATKQVCVPGLSCYSCPGALGACPIGSLQAVLDSGKFKMSCYVFGFLMLFGSLMGRFVCGWLCPFGWVQDLLHKIPLFQKKKNMPGHRFLRYGRYVVLVLFVIILPMTVLGAAGMGDPWFCKYLCPLGAVYGVFNPIALYRFTVDEELCVRCGGCQKVCGMDIPVWEKPNSTECIRCGDCKAFCPTGAIRSSLQRVQAKPYGGIESPNE